MEKRRPDPQSVLERVQAEEADVNRGHLKIYIGMAAGSGKTFSMLTDAIADKKRGLDVVAGYIEPHGRIETERLADNLESLAALKAVHRGVHFREFPLDAALARKPMILLVDELAHTNAPGSRHEKRWQDIDEILARGISVHTTINVQHLESVSDVISKITGVDVNETVPDSFVAKADEIELIDITPDELIQRLKEGKIYEAGKVPQALNNFFRKGNLIALREIVLRLAAERVQEQLYTFRRQHGVREVWPAAPKILVCISPNRMAARVVRTASRLANNLHADLVALSVDTLSSSSKVAATDGVELAETLGAKIIRRVSNDIVQEIIDVAHEINATIVVVGKPIRSRLREYLWGSVVDELIRNGGDLDVYIITDDQSESNVPLIAKTKPPSARGFLSALIVTGIATLVCMASHPMLESSNLIMIYLLAVTWAAAKLGRTEAIVTSIASVLAFDFFFVPPYFTFAVSNVQYLVTFSVMLVIALLISSLTLRIKGQARIVAEREQRTASLYEVSKRLASAVTTSEIALVIKEKSFDLFRCEAALFLPDDTGSVLPALATSSAFENKPNEIAVARWVSDRKEKAGAGTSTLAGASATYIALSKTSAAAPVLGVCRADSIWDSGYDSLLDAFATQVGSALERVQMEQEATSIQVQVERERLRNVLLSSVSHDLRTPLAAIGGAAAALKERFLTPDPRSRELADTIIEETNRLTRIVRNVLDISKLESGTVVPKTDWEAIDELLITVLARIKPLLGDRVVRLNFSPDLPLIQGDAILIEQLFINLLENEAKHTPASAQIEIAIRVENPWLKVEITDNGPGLPRGEEDRIFEKLYRGSKSGGQGFGLGLTICRAIMKLHAGRIEARDLLTGGASFTLFFPLAASQPEVVLG